MTKGRPFILASEQLIWAKKYTSYTFSYAAPSVTFNAVPLRKMTVTVTVPVAFAEHDVAFCRSKSIPFQPLGSTSLDQSTERERERETERKEGNLFGLSHLVTFGDKLDLVTFGDKLVLVTFGDKGFDNSDVDEIHF